MGRESNTMNHYFSDSRRFADLFNAVCFRGKPIVQPENLSDASEVYHQLVAEKPQRGNRMKRAERIRDVCKTLKNGGVLRLLAVENQGTVNYAMPFRCMQYDAMEYGKQLDELRRRNKRERRFSTEAERLSGVLREDRMVPVYTLCLYYGEEKWDGPRSLKDMMCFDGTDDGFKDLFNDYPLHLYCLNEVENLGMFRTEVGTLFRALQYRGNRSGLQQLLRYDVSYRHLDGDTLEAMSVLLNLPDIWEHRKSIVTQSSEKEEYDMCQAVREWAEEERAIGREEGLEECRVLIVRNLIRRGETDEEIMEVTECDRLCLERVRKMIQADKNCV